MTAAAKYLTPVTLELGGKSPVVIDQNCNIALAAKRILNGKTFNCGQICLAPDYVLLHKSQETAFFDELKKGIQQFYPKGQQQDDSYARIINDTHFKRLKGLLVDHGGEEVMGGLKQCDEKQRLFVTTVVKNPQLSSKLMQEEIFGPILPVVIINDIEEAVQIINERDKPLGLYVFSNDQTTVDNVLTRCQSGGATVNDILMHIIVDGLPFGGVGPSGFGVTHGRAGFDEFSHVRSVLHRGNTSLDLLGSARYPPFNEGSYKLLTRVSIHATRVKSVIGTVMKIGVPVAVGTALYFFW
jgi:acyl-CoA reductase-like NAD-dependent aldehyde dehydrogenase